jgi:aspartyl-tRNA(Asn)/glutamyl-tRNA(Gln) amidotransferase subunit A
MNIFADFRDRITKAIDALDLVPVAGGSLDYSRLTVEPPRDAAHGDIATNAAMVLSKAVGENPRALAGRIAERLAADPEVAAAIEAALQVYRDLGAELVDIELAPLPEYVACLRPIMASEAYAWHRKHLESNGNAYGALARDRIGAGAKLNPADYLDAMEARKRLQAAFGEAMRGVEAALTIVTLAPPPRFDDTDGLARSFSLEGRPPFNIVRAPALAMPMGATKTGLPLSIQVIGHHFDEATVYRVAAAYEAETEWTKRKPAL